MIQGWTPDFIPQVLQESVDQQQFDQVLPVNGEDGMRWAARLAAEEGILTGISGGSTLATAMKWQRTPRGIGIFGDASRYWRALPFHTAFRIDPRRDERRGTGAS